MIRIIRWLLTSSIWYSIVVRRHRGRRTAVGSAVGCRRDFAGHRRCVANGRLSADRPPPTRRHRPRGTDSALIQQVLVGMYRPLLRSGHGALFRLGLVASDNKPAE
jgi:hypothetical protein